MSKLCAPKNTKQFSNLATRRLWNYSAVEKSMEIVREFIKSNDFILYGGMSIDFALKLAGHEGIYDTNTIPDYDFYAPDIYNTSNKLADILHGSGIPGLSSINASHLTTRRVRTDFIEVADISYLPPKVYDTLPTLKFNDFRIVHPNFQRLDMHRAFNNPYENSPNELVYFRSEKDSKRFKLLDEHYPIEFKEFKDDIVEFKVKGLKSGLLTDLAAFAVYCELYKQHNSVGKEMFLLSARVENGELFVMLPKSYPIIAFHAFEEIAKEFSGKEVEKYHRFLDDSKPPTTRFEIENGFLDVYDSKYNLIPCHEIEFQNLKLKIANVHDIASHFLTNRFLYQDENWMCFYHSLLQMMKAMESLYPEKKEACNPWFLTAEFYGNETINFSRTQVLQLEKNYAFVDRDNELLSFLNSLRPPHGYYPENNSEPPEFKEITEVFLIDGSIVKTN